jgi:cysteine desulfuration protein SufE
MTLDSILADFELLDDWEDRYRYLIELGRGLPPLPEAARTDANKVRGCASQVWLATEVDGAAGATPRLSFQGDSDAHIVRGLIAIMIAIYSNRYANEIVMIDARDIFQHLGLAEHLTPQRSNGFASMLEAISASPANPARDLWLHEELVKVTADCPSVDKGDVDGLAPRVRGTGLLEHPSRSMRPSGRPSQVGKLNR